VPGRRVGLTIPTTPRHRVKLMGTLVHRTAYRQRACGATTKGLHACSPYND
jgi:hypothetical protein